MFRWLSFVREAAGVLQELNFVEEGKQDGRETSFERVSPLVSTLTDRPYFNQHLFLPLARARRFALCRWMKLKAFTAAADAEDAERAQRESG
jgi:hypothetical protein